MIFVDEITLTVSPRHDALMIFVPLPTLQKAIIRQAALQDGREPQHYAEETLPFIHDAVQAARRRRRDDLIRFWNCGQHAECWGAGHLTTGSVTREARRCHVTCVCWRHWVTGQMGQGKG